MRDVVIDTNILLLPFTQGLALMDELERLLGAVRPIMPAPVAKELLSLSEGNDATARAAEGARRLCRAWAFETSRLPGDDGVLDVARRLGAVVVTNDQKLQAEARKSELRVVVPRGRDQLMVVN